MTKIFPNAVNPIGGPYNRQQFSALTAYCEVEVLATIPWFPGASLAARWSEAGRLAAVPRRDRIAGLAVTHPRTVFIPKLPSTTGLLYAASVAPYLARYRGKIDVILASWAYPDGWAAVALSSLLGVPAVVKTHGSDINVVARMPGPRRMLRWVLPRAARVVCVSRALARATAELGVAEDKIAVVYNGVDSELFRVGDRAAARAALGLPAEPRILLSVANLKRPKGVIDLLDAFAPLAARRDDVVLVLVGDGDDRAECEARARAIGDGQRVILAGARPYAEVGQWMTACDVITLPSWAEGTPSVLMEALACGRRAVATTVGGIPDLISSPELGELVEPRDIPALTAALDRALDHDYDPAAIAAKVPFGDWHASAGRLFEVLSAAVAEHPRRGS